MTTFSEFRCLVSSDLYRYTGDFTAGMFIKNVLFLPGFKYSFLLRLCRFLKSKKYFFPLYLIARFLHRHYSFRYGMEIPVSAEIGPGFYIGHFGGIIVNPGVKIGANCNISHGVTLGQINRGSREGTPVIGDEVYIAPGVKIIGKVIVGNRAAIGANCVVVEDVPDDGVVVGIPGKVISTKGSEGYINRKWETPC